VVHSSSTRPDLGSSSRAASRMAPGLPLRA
jgi:hypothetical protein